MEAFSRLILLLLLIVTSRHISQKTAGLLVLWYDSPAKEWMTQALPVGNGYVGMMFLVIRRKSACSSPKVVSGQGVSARLIIVRGL